MNITAKGLLQDKGVNMSEGLKIVSFYSKQLLHSSEMRMQDKGIDNYYEDYSYIKVCTNKRRNGVHDIQE
jgi:hypothetical protein